MKIEELAGIKDFSKFEKTIYIDEINKDTVATEYLGFEHRLNDDEYSDFFSQCESIYWQSNKDNTLTFRRGWSKKEYMPIPVGMDEEMYVEIYVNHLGMDLTYIKNPCVETVTKDSLDKFLGVVMPDFTIINYVSPDWTTIQFNDSIPEETYKKLEMNDWCYRKCDEQGCTCFIDKGSTSMELDCQTLIATLHK